MRRPIDRLIEKPGAFGTLAAALIRPTRVLPGVSARIISNKNMAGGEGHEAGQAAQGKADK